jgi:2-polyprenyl-6-hydroxyphenyl methylase/3-demethylubiquinone-9 3-methyltransferase
MQHEQRGLPAGGNVSPAEIARFATLAEAWWDPAGPMRALHRMNPLRIDWALARFRERCGARPLRLLDVGCGAGLAAEALARAGHEVIGLDASDAVIAAARRHAEGRNLPLGYRVGTLATLIDEGQIFDAITAFEVIEHVPEPRLFLAELSTLLAPGGVLVLSTLNRTRRSLVLGKFAAEYVLRWVPAGTHDWQRFQTPAEVEDGLAAAGMGVFDLTGVSFDALRQRFRLSSDVAINYLLAAWKPSPERAPRSP